MLEIVLNGGWIMLPIIVASIIAVAIIGERALTLKQQNIVPNHLLDDAISWIQPYRVDAIKLRELQLSSPLGRIFASLLMHADQGHAIAQRRAEETAAHEIHELQRYMDVLANIATITPLMGLLGTVIGMIKVFAEIMLTGTGQASLLAGGISEALITTAAGLLVAIPVLICHRWLQRKIDDSVVLMEQQSRRLLDVYMDSVESNEQPRAAVANRDHSL